MKQLTMDTEKKFDTIVVGGGNAALLRRDQRAPRGCLGFSGRGGA